MHQDYSLVVAYTFYAVITSTCIFSRCTYLPYGRLKNQAHALMEYLKEQGQNDQANQLMESMYSEYFEKAQNINDDNVLAALCARTVDRLAEATRTRP